MAGRQTQQKIYHVFVSSTYSDLKDERKRVSEAIAKAGYVPEGMELFPASSEKQLAFIKRVIDRCDYYVVVVGGRYGSVSDTDNVSYTEREYEYAQTLGLPALAFLHRNPDKIESGKVEQDKKAKLSLESFRKRLKDSAMVDFWDDAAGLAASVVVALGQEVNLNPGVGWVRGDQVADPKLFEELSSTKQRLADLAAAHVSSASKPVTFPADLAPVEEVFEVKVVVVNTDAQARKTEQTLKIEVSWQSLFLAAYDGIISREEEFVLVNALWEKFVRQKIGDSAEGSEREVKSRLWYLQMRSQFEALGLIVSEVSGGRDGPRSVPLVNWHLTEKGKQYAARSRAWTKNRNL